MNRAVFDTNALISAFANLYGAPGQIYFQWKQNKFELVLSDFIISQFIRIARTKLRSPQAAIELFIFNLYKFVDLVEPATVNHFDIKENDWPILGTAAAGRVNMLITGDKLLLRLKVFQGIAIITPRQFLDQTLI